MTQYQEQVVSQPVNPSEIYAGMMQEERVKNILAQTSPDNQLEEIEWRIRGYRRDAITRDWVKIGTQHEVSDLLVSRYIAFLSAFLNDGTRFTNLSDRNINNLMAMCIQHIIDDLDNNADEYGLVREGSKDYDEMNRISLIILGQTFIVLKRAENGMESKRFWGTLNLNENVNGMPQKKGFLEKLKFW
jgi:hypothetical protein